MTDDESIPTPRHCTSPCASKQSPAEVRSKTRTSSKPTKNCKSKVKNVTKTTIKKVTRKKNVTANTTKPNKNDEANRLWKNVDETFLHPNSNTHFVEHVGLKRPAYQADSPLECLRLFLTAEVLNQIVTETNRYRTQQNAAKPSPLPWHDLTVEELLAFFAIILAMGLIKLPELELYWRRNSIFEMHWFGSILTIRRFKQILRYLHLSNNQADLPPGDPNRDKLFKLGMLPSILSQKFFAMNAPARELSIDEQMIGTKARISFIQYMPKKPKKFGIKIWALCESQSGYCLQFQIYTGKSADAVEHGLAYRVVFDLMKKYLNKNYVVYFDNFYTSFKLMDDLDKKQTYACGTLRKGRAQLPSEFVNAKLDVGDAIYRKRNNTVAVHWKDKRDVFCLSTFHAPGETLVNRYIGEVTKPNIVCEYNTYMGGVDKLDQFLSYYTLCRKSTKWWKKVFFRLLELCVVNAFCIYNAKHPKFKESRRSHQKFREALIYELIQPLINKRDQEEANSNATIPENRPVKRRTVSSTRLKGKHYSSETEGRKKCTVCAYQINQKTGKRRDTKTRNFCEKCNVHVCKKCFKKFHTTVNLKKK